jgi:hypothetical protein
MTDVLVSDVRPNRRDQQLTVQNIHTLQETRMSAEIWERTKLARASYLGSLPDKIDETWQGHSIYDLFGKVDGQKTEKWSNFSHTRFLNREPVVDINGLTGVIDGDIVRFNASTDNLPNLPDNPFRSRFTALTRLERLNFQIAVGRKALEDNDGDLQSTIEDGSTFIKSTGGWLSGVNVNSSLSQDILAQDPKAISILIDHIGMANSRFLFPQTVKEDLFKLTFAELHMAEQMALGPFGLSDEQITRRSVVWKGLGKKLSRIYHSRAAAAGFFYPRLGDDNTKIYLAAPVIDEIGLKPKLTNNALAVVNTVNGWVSGKPVVEPIREAVRDIVVSYLSGDIAPEVKSAYTDNFESTDADVRVGSLGYIYKSRIPQPFKHYANPKHVQIGQYLDDNFINSEALYKHMLTLWGQDYVDKVVHLVPGGHHEHLRKGSSEKDRMIKFVLGIK